MRRDDDSDIEWHKVPFQLPFLYEIIYNSCYNAKENGKYCPEYFAACAHGCSYHPNIIDNPDGTNQCNYS
jgi:hypothetical protein